MDFRFPFRSIEVIGHLLNQQTDKINKITYTPQKPLFEHYQSSSPLPRKTPEETGIDSSYIEDFFHELCRTTPNGLHGVMILKQGAVITEASFAPYSNDIPHICHSLSKSVVALAIGLAIEEGYLSLDDKIIDIFSDEYNLLSLNFRRMKNLTIEHLLTMSSGIQFNELGAITMDDWVKGFLDSAFLFEPGSRFQYNSMNTFMLSAVIEKCCGCPASIYLQDKLFKPLNIQLPYWEKSPTEIEKGGWGLSLYIEDMAKIGQLLLQRGRWQDQQLIPAEWIDLATSHHIDTPDKMNRYGYGYHFWKCPGTDAFCCNGMLGQNIAVFPSTGMVVVTTGGCSQFFPNGPLMDTILQYFSEEAVVISKYTLPLPTNTSAHKHLLNLLNHPHSNKFITPSPHQQRIYHGGWKGHPTTAVSALPPETQQLSGRTWHFEANTNGIMPLCIQCMHNSYSSGISSLQFDIRDNHFFMTVHEGQNVSEINIGFHQPVENIFIQNGEYYRISALGMFTRDEDNHLVLKLELAFTETSNCRIIKCFFIDNQLKLVLDELPHMQELVTELEKMVGANIGMEKLTDSMKGITDMDYAQYRMEKIFSPSLRSQ